MARALVALLCSQLISVAGVKTDCYRGAPSILKKDLREELCQAAGEATGPAEVRRAYSFRTKARADERAICVHAIARAGQRERGGWRE